MGLILVWLLAASQLLACGEEGPSETSDNHFPVIDTLIVETAIAIPEDSIQVEVRASDPDGDSLAYYYTVDDGTIVGSGSIVDWIVPRWPGTYSLFVVVSDGRGGLDSESRDVLVEEEPTGLRGTATLVSITESLEGARFALYTSLAAYENGNPYYIELVPSDSQISYSFVIVPLPPGTYYIDLWKDVNNSGTIDHGDLYGWHGSGTWANHEMTAVHVAVNQVVYIGTFSVY